VFVALGLLSSYPVQAFQYALAGLWRASTDPLYCDTGSLATTCTIFTIRTFANGTAITGVGSLVVASGGQLTNSTPTQTLSIAMTGSVTVQNGGTILANLSSLTASSLNINAGGTINASALGFLGGRVSGNATNQGLGTGPGLASSTLSHGGGGGGHAGTGGNGAGATATGAGGLYGSSSDPNTFGSGGSIGMQTNHYGGNGGGKVRINLGSGTATINGTLTVNGNQGTYTGAGGAGGAIKLTCGTLAGTGTISAAGGDGGSHSNPLIDSGGGSGGRIAIDSNNLFAGTIVYSGGGSGKGDASTGSFYTSLPSNDAICDAASTWATTCNVTSNQTLGQNLSLSGANLTIASGITLTTGDVSKDFINLSLSGTLTVNGTFIANFATLNAATVTVNSGGLIRGNMGGPIAGSQPGLTATSVNVGGGITADPRHGFAGGGVWYWNRALGQGPGGGLHSLTRAEHGGGGGGYGGAGGNGNDAAGGGGGSYGSATYPTDYGSGGADSNHLGGHSGGSGGGIVRMTVSGTLTFVGTGTIQARGSSSIYSGAGGAGGTILLRVGAIAGAGTINAFGSSGGNRGGYQGGGGGGGRVSILADSGPAYTGFINVAGGAAGGAGATAGGAGTLNETYDYAYCDTGSRATTCTISSDRTFANGTAISGAGSLVVASGGVIRNVNSMQSLTIAMTGAVTVQTGGMIRANLADLSGSSVTVETGASIDASTLGGLGGRQPGNATNNGQGPSPGHNASGGMGDISGAGGGHGGAGGDGLYAGNGATGGVIIGSASNPTNYGSGGAAHWTTDLGGNGGGFVKITSAGAVTLNGTVSSAAGNGSQAGGGSGGTIYIDAATIVGTGSLNASGGANGNPTYNNITDGSGAGGRVYVRANTFFAGTVTYSGGRGVTGFQGGKGSYYGVLISGSNDSICDSGAWASTCTITSSKAVPQNFLTLSGNNLAIGAGGKLTVTDPTDLLDITLTGNASIIGADAMIQAQIKRLQAVNFTLGDAQPYTGTIVGNVGGTNSGVDPGLVLTGTLTVTAGGQINSDSFGYAGGFSGLRADYAGSGPSPGQMNTDGSYRTGTGGAHGGVGGKSNAPSSVDTTAYDTNTNPSDFGSGGGSGGTSASPGGNGGGLIRASVTGAMTINGSISASGGIGSTSGWYQGGGAAGGTINIRGLSFTGSGSIVARGGAGQADQTQSGGGGGGRIALVRSNGAAYAGTVQVTGGAAGGGGANAGGTGTIYQFNGSTITGTGPVTANNTATSTVTITLKDYLGAAVVGVVPTFTANGTGNSYQVCSSSDGSGVSTCTMTSTTAEVKTMSIATPVILSGGTVQFDP